MVGCLLAIGLWFQPPVPSIRGVCWTVLVCGCDCLRADVLGLFLRVPICLCRAPCCCHWWKSPSVVWRCGTTWTHVMPFSRKAVSLSSTSQKIISFSLLAALAQISLTLLTQKIQLCYWEEFENERLVPIFFFLINHLGGLCFFFSSWNSFFRVKAGSSQRELAPQTRLPTDVVRLRSTCAACQVVSVRVSKIIPWRTSQPRVFPLQGTLKPEGWVDFTKTIKMAMGGTESQIQISLFDSSWHLWCEG